MMIICYLTNNGNKISTMKKEFKMKKVLATAAVFSLFIGAGSVSAATLTDVETLGKDIYNSTFMSYNETQSCASCHSPFSGFADPDNLLDPVNSMVSVGADGVSTGGRNAPSAAYAGFSPMLHLDQSGEYVGGMFWDGRATGHTLHDPLAEQAQGPPLNPVEMNMPSKDAIIASLAKDPAISSDYFKVYNEDLSDPNLDVDVAYDNIARAIAAFERSFEVTRFTSVFDTQKLKGKAAQGKTLFMQNCTTCHAYGRHGGADALFTNYKYVNAGLPENDKLLAICEADPTLNCNYAPPDLGLGITVGDPVVGDPAQNGKFKVPTLRNVARTAPYSHNGYFASLKEMVSFMNNNSGYIPEVSENVYNRNFGLSEDDINAIVAFLETLTDVPYPTAP